MASYIARRKVAERRGWDVVEVYRDAGISGAKGRNGRPGLDTNEPMAAGALVHGHCELAGSPCLCLRDRRSARTIWRSRSSCLLRANTCGGACARPAGQVTAINAELVSKWLSLAGDLVPQVRGLVTLRQTFVRRSQKGVGTDSDAPVP